MNVFQARVLGVFFGLTILNPALASESSILPSCVPEFKNGMSLRFQFDSREKYAREIRAELSPLLCGSSSASIKANWPLPDGLLWKSIPPGATELFGVRLSEELRDRIVQAQLGADVYRPTALSAKAIAASIERFTLEENRRLTRAYGNGFAGEVYRAWVEGKERNSIGHRALIGEIDRQSSIGNESGVSELKAKSRNAVLVVAMGIGWSSEPSESSPEYVRDFIENVSTLGIETVILKRPAFGTMEGNARRMETQIRGIVESGRDVVLFGLCKGSPEVLAAATRVMSPYLDSENRQTRMPEGHGKIVGSISVSGMFGGILFADALERLSVPNTTESFLLASGARYGMGSLVELGAYINVMRDVTSERVGSFMREIYPRLPSDVVYLNSTGVIPGDGLLGEEDTTAMNPFIKANRRFHLAQGANDGFIEYPGNLMPSAVAPHVYDFVFASSHMVSDGIYHGRSLRDPEVRRAVYRSFMNLALDFPREAR